jgi:hypothetical protein
VRLSFSLRLVFLAFTLSAAALYWCIARPTILANRFVAAVNLRDFESAKRMLPNFWLFNRRPNSPPLDMVYAEVFPREWTDLHMFQRRIIVRVGRHHDNRGQHVEWTEDTDIVVRPQGLEIETPVGINFQWPDERPENLPAIINPNENIYLERNPRTS